MTLPMLRFGISSIDQKAAADDPELVEPSKPPPSNPQFRGAERAQDAPQFISLDAPASLPDGGDASDRQYLTGEFAPPWSPDGIEIPNTARTLHKEIQSFCRITAPTPEEHTQREAVVQRLRCSSPPI